MARRSTRWRSAPDRADQEPEPRGQRPRPSTTLVPQLVALLESNRRSWTSSGRWPWVFVDEYQDVDEHQYELLRLLVPPDGNICAIGDPDQAIYSFRGADVQFFLRFSQDFVDARVVRLTRNYRSSAPIIAAAVQAIAPSYPDQGPAARSGQGRPGGAADRPLPRRRPRPDEAGFIAKRIDELVGGVSHRTKADVRGVTGATRVLRRHRRALPHRRAGGRDRRGAVPRLDPGAETFARPASRPGRGQGARRPSCAWTTA